MSKELQNCRFCGGEGFIAVIDENAFVASCRDCGIHTQVQTSRERAIALWNRRLSPWHTGTPTKDGTFIVLWEDTDEQVERYSKLHFNEYNNTWYDEETLGCNWGDEYHAKVIAWMEIEPYKP